ncbi:glutathione S-transferase C-terminal domain-containing protein [Microcoleus sp. MOSTC5]
MSPIIYADFQVFSDFLANKPFFMGAPRATLDATACGYIGNFMRSR